MTTIPAASIVKQLIAVLREAFEGPREVCYFTDNQPHAGVSGTIEKFSAAEASRPSGPNGTSVAAQVYHVVFSLAAASAWIRGDHSSRDWKESWRVSTVNDAEWTRLQSELRREYEELLRAIESEALSSEKAFGGSVAAIAHTAYHLGAIRQRAAASARAASRRWPGKALGITPCLPGFRPIMALRD